MHRKHALLLAGALIVATGVTLPLAAAAPPGLPPPPRQLAVASDSHSTTENTDAGTFVAAGALRDANGRLTSFEDRGTFRGSVTRIVSYKDGPPKALDAVNSFRSSKGTFVMKVHVEFQDLVGETRIARDRAQTYAPALASGPFHAVIAQATGVYARMRGTSTIGTFVRSNSLAKIPPGLPRPSLNFLKTIAVFPVS